MPGAIFVGVVVGVLNVFTYTPPAPPPSRLNIIFDLEAVKDYIQALLMKATLQLRYLREVEKIIFDNRP
jgi:hypothetical protein